MFVLGWGGSYSWFFLVILLVTVTVLPAGIISRFVLKFSSISLSARGFEDLIHTLGYSRVLANCSLALNTLSLVFRSGSSDGHCLGLVFPYPSLKSECQTLSGRVRSCVSRAKTEKSVREDHRLYQNNNMYTWPHILSWCTMPDIFANEF